MSSFYLNVLKDRMYCSPAGDPARRSAQTAIFEIARGLLSLTAPVLSFTTDEAWGYLPAYPGKPESVFLSDLPEPLGIPEAEAIAARWQRILDLRSEVAQPLETARREKVIGSGQDALVTIAPGPFADLFETHAREIRDALIVSGIVVGEATGAGDVRERRLPGAYGRGGKGAVGKMRTVLEPHARGGDARRDPGAVRGGARPPWGSD